VEELSARLVERGHEVTVFNRWHPGTKARQHRGIKIRYVPVFGGKHLRNLTQSTLGTIAATLGGYDIVHFHALGPCLASPLARLRPRARLVVTLQGRDDQRAKWSRPAQVVLAAAAWMSAHVPHAGIAVSKQLQREFLEEFGRDTTHIPNGVTVNAPAVAGDDDPLQRFGLEPGRYLLNVGRLVPEKAIDHLLQAFRDVPGDVRLAIVGGSSHTDEYTAKLQELAAADPRIVLTGPIYGAGTDRLFRNALGYVMPSLLEGLPLALLEAIAYGLPVVVSDIEPHLEIVGESGPGHRVFATGDLEQLAKAVTALVNEPDIEQAGAYALRDAVLVDYSWEAVAERTDALYQRLVPPSRG
jgi:glycosyltransferase involved in cell wall biosynthesis